MRSFPSAFVTEKNKKTGAAPCWILKLTVNAVDYYLSDHVVTVASWNGGVTTKAWVSSWGDVQEQVSGVLAEIRLADVSITCVIDPDASPNMETLATDSTLEKAPAILYLWFKGLTASTDPPQEIFRGYVSEAAIPSEATVSLIIEDATVRLHNMVGTLITTANYPNADPDDVGRILPLPYGVVRNVPGRATVAGLLTTLKADITAGATSCAVARPDGIVANTTKFRIGSEIVLVAAVSGDTLTITRAQNSTTAAAHTAGDRLLEVMANPFAFVVSGHALTSIDKVVVRSGDVDVDITDQCTRYTGQGGSQYSTYGAKGVVTITEAQAAVIRGRVQKTAQLALTDNGHIHGTGALAYIYVPMEDIVITGGGTTAWEDYCQYAFDNNWNSGRQAGTYSGGNDDSEFHRRTPFSAQGTIKRVRLVVKTGHATYSGSVSFLLYWKGLQASNSLSAGGSTPTITYGAWNTLSNLSGWTDLHDADTEIRMATGTYPAASSFIWEVGLEVEYEPSTPSAGAEISGSINSVADLLLGGPVHADVTAPNTDPADVFTDLLTTWGGGVSLTPDGSLSVSYKFNGVLLKQEEILRLLHRLAFQCRCWFRLAAGAARLIVRPNTLASEKTIAAVKLDGGRKSLARRKADAADIVNKINLRYDRDWAKPDGDDAYRMVSSSSDATSITDYGERERPELFLCDFITTTAMADAVRNFYLADLKRRKWIYEFETFLDHSELEFGDIVTLGFAGNAVVELLQAGLSPGADGDLPVIRMVGRG